jgi:hypothetical protein
MLIKSQYRQLLELAFRRDAKTKKIITVQANLTCYSMWKSPNDLSAGPVARTNLYYNQYRGGADCSSSILIGAGAPPPLRRLPGRICITICITNTDAEEEQRDVSERERRHQQDLQVLLRRDSLNKALDGAPDRAGGDASGGRGGGGGEGEDAEAAELQKKLGLLEEQVGMLCSSVLSSSMLSVCPQSTTMYVS